jgi:hypothetical protein
MIALGSVIHEIAGATFTPESIMNSNCLKQSRFARTVFASKEANPGSQDQFVEVNSEGRGGSLLPSLYKIPSMKAGELARIQKDEALSH